MTIKQIESEKINWNFEGFFTWPNQDDQMNMTKIGEHVDKDER